MPPKKKGKKGKKGKKKSKDGELNEDDRLKMKIHEVDALKDNLAFRRDFSKKTKAAYEEMKEKLEETNNHIEELESIHKASSAYLTNQYKSMQNEMEIKLQMLENELNSTRKNLEDTEIKLADVIQEKKRIIEQKDEKIEELNQKVKNIQVAFDSVINSTLDGFNSNLLKKKMSWENSSMKLQTNNKKKLAELGLRIHDI
jgi:chromosome segregation ATPase